MGGARAQALQRCTPLPFAAWQRWQGMGGGAAPGRWQWALQMEVLLFWTLQQASCWPARACTGALCAAWMPWDPCCAARGMMAPWGCAG